MRNKLTKLFVIFSIMSSHFTYGADFVVRAGGAEAIDFQAFVAAQGQTKTLAQWLYSQNPSEAENQALVTAFANAQSLFFQVEKAKALDGFANVIQLRTQSDWREPQTRFIFTAALRAAELTDDENKRIEYLNLAASYLRQHTLDKKMFAPPLVRQLESLNIERISGLTPTSWLGFEILSINGERHPLRQNSVLSLPKGVHRATLYSSAYKTQSIVIESSQLLNWTPEKRAWVEGSCDKHNLDDDLMAYNPIVFFNSKCIHETKPTAKPKSLALAPIAPSQFRKQTEISLSSAAPPQAEVNTWWKNKWLWVGIASAGAAYLIYDNNRGSSASNSSGPVVYE